MPKEEGGTGQMVMPEMSQRAVKIEARAKIKLISDSTSVTPTDCVCAEMLFPHESNGRIRALFFFRSSSFILGALSPS